MLICRKIAVSESGEELERRRVNEQWVGGRTGAEEGEWEEQSFEEWRNGLLVSIPMKTVSWNSCVVSQNLEVHFDLCVERRDDPTLCMELVGYSFYIVVGISNTNMDKVIIVIIIDILFDLWHLSRWMNLRQTLLEIISEPKKYGKPNTESRSCHSSLSGSYLCDETKTKPIQI